MPTWPGQSCDLPQGPWPERLRPGALLRTWPCLALPFPSLHPAVLPTWVPSQRGAGAGAGAHYPNFRVSAPRNCLLIVFSLSRSPLQRNVLCRASSTFRKGWMVAVFAFRPDGLRCDGLAAAVARKPPRATRPRARLLSALFTKTRVASGPGTPRVQPAPRSRPLPTASISASFGKTSLPSKDYPSYLAGVAQWLVSTCEP